MSDGFLPPVRAKEKAMHVYLLQHARAMPSEENPLRPLSETGRSDACRMADYLHRHVGLKVLEVVHSGRERAAQTAEIIADTLGVACNAAAGLMPSDDPEIWASQLKLRTKDVMVVGHLPHLQRLVGLLLCNDDALSVVHFRNGGVICLQHGAAGEWSIDWVLTPQVLPA